ncbi:hypothetical protein RFI_22676, partial [Reticulomyxa filosa]
MYIYIYIFYFFLGILGDFNFDELISSNGGLGRLRAALLQWIFIVWMVFALVVLLNFIIALMTGSFDDVRENVTASISYHQLKIARTYDKRLPSIPAPFQPIVWVFKFLWFTVFEPVIYFFTGKFVNEERLICNFDHWKRFKTENYYATKCGDKKILRAPYFVEYADHMHSNALKPPTSIIQRVLQYGRVRKEMMSGALNMHEQVRKEKNISSISPSSSSVLNEKKQKKDSSRKKNKTFNGIDNEHAKKETETSIWICTYCRATNFEFEHDKRLFNDYNDIKRFANYNDSLPPQFAFLDKDLQFFEYLNPSLCDNCFRYRNSSKRHEIIESLLAFYLYCFMNFLFIRLPVLLLLTFIAALFGICLAPLWGARFLFYTITTLVCKCGQCAITNCKKAVIKLTSRGNALTYNETKLSIKKKALLKSDEREIADRLINKGGLVQKVDLQSIWNELIIEQSGLENDENATYNLILLVSAANLNDIQRENIKKLFAACEECIDNYHINEQSNEHTSKKDWKKNYEVIRNGMERLCVNEIANTHIRKHFHTSFVIFRGNYQNLQIVSQRYWSPFEDYTKNEHMQSKQAQFAMMKAKKVYTFQYTPVMERIAGTSLNFVKYMLNNLALKSFLNKKKTKIKSKMLSM